MTNVTASFSEAALARRWHTGRIIAAVLLGAFVFAAAVAGWWEIDLYRANWGVVVPGQIFRSAQMPSWLIRRKVEENHIGVIIFLSHDDMEDPDLQAEKQVANDEAVQFLNFPMMGDGVAKPEMYTKALLALCSANRAGQRVLVHCHSGAQRTGGVIAVYRMLVEKIPADQALAEMRFYGHDPKKNLTLIPFLNAHIGEWADALAKAGVIDKVPEPLPQLIVPTSASANQ